MAHVVFVVDQVPVAQPRQRHALVGGFVRNYVPKSDPVHVFKLAVVTAFKQTGCSQFTGLVSVRIACIFPRLAGHMWKKREQPRAWTKGKKDWDNLGKSVCDALNKFAWLDDSQVCDGRVLKIEAAGGESPKVVVRIDEVDASPSNIARLLDWMS